MRVKTMLSFSALALPLFLGANTALGQLAAFRSSPTTVYHQPLSNYQRDGFTSNGIYHPPVDDEVATSFSVQANERFTIYQVEFYGRGGGTVSSLRVRLYEAVDGPNFRYVPGAQIGADIITPAPTITPGNTYSKYSAPVPPFSLGDALINGGSYHAYFISITPIIDPQSSNSTVGFQIAPAEFRDNLFDSNVISNVQGDSPYVFGEWNDTTLIRPGDYFSAAITAYANVERVCDVDLNRDGVVDQGDVDYIVNAIASGDNPTEVNLDLDYGGTFDQGDVDIMINVAAGGLCPF